jgi:hypothetical protein
MKLKCEECGNTRTFQVDGYDFGDRLLEGVMFSVAIREGKLKCIGYPKDGYTGTLNMDHWMRVCNDYLKDADFVYCKKCNAPVSVQVEKKKKEQKLPQPLMVEAMSLGKFVDECKECEAKQKKEVATKVKTKKLYLKAHLPNLMKMCAKEIKNPGISMGLAAALSYLNGIAKVAIERDDKVILAYLNQIGLIEGATEKEEEEFQEILEKGGKE